MGRPTRDPVHDGTIQTLPIQEGKKWDARTGEGAIASIDRCIIFAPRGAVPGKSARLKLAVLKDSAGNVRVDAGGYPMYRSTPAPVEYFDHWRDNGNKTVTRVTVSRNWLLEEAEEGECETRPVLKTKVWAGEFESHRLDPSYQDSWSLTTDAYYTETDYVRNTTVWGGLPLWLRQETEALRPVCVCGRQRVDTPNISDGYAKCELCRGEEECDLCGRENTRVKIFEGRRICSACEQMAEQVKQAEQKLDPAARQAVADEARRLLAGKALPREAGEVLLACLPDASGSAGYAGFAWYYLCVDGVFGSKFSPEALELLTLLPVAQGNGLARMAGWLIGGGGRKVSECENSDYFWKTQVQDKDELPDLRWSSPTASCAVRLRGPVRPPKPQPKPPAPKPPAETVTTASGFDLSQLFGGQAHVRRR